MSISSQSWDVWMKQDLTVDKYLMKICELKLYSNVRECQIVYRAQLAFPFIVDKVYSVQKKCQVLNIFIYSFPFWLNIYLMDPTVVDSASLAW